MFLKECLQSLYLFDKNTVKIVILWNIVTIFLNVKMVALFKYEYQWINEYQIQKNSIYLTLLFNFFATI